MLVFESKPKRQSVSLRSCYTGCCVCYTKRSSVILVYEFTATLPAAVVNDILNNGVTIGELTEHTLCLVL